MPSARDHSQNPNRDSCTRRKFISATTTSVAAGFLASKSSHGVAGDALPSSAASPSSGSAVEQLLREAVMPRDAVDKFLDPTAQVWAKFHPIYGYLLRDSFMRDGVDGSHTLARYTKRGYRRQVNLANMPCRINTYGDSFTQGHQVSDGETWQEVLAAHFCEPVRNYGIGGFGVYQAYRRLMEIEESDLGASHVILNIWGDDHHRSIMACRWLSFNDDFLSNMPHEMFHANPWAHARLDPNTGELIEIENACLTPESLYRMCDEEYVVETFRNDVVIHAYAAMRTGQLADTEPLEKMAAAIGFDRLDFSSNEAIRNTASQLHAEYAVGVGIRIVEKLQTYLQARDKRLFVLLSHPAGSVWHHCAGKKDDRNFVDWHPKKFREFLAKSNIPYVNTVEKHINEFKQFRTDAKAYVDRYYIGHYNPQGNHFFAYAIKDELLNWLDPKPPAYRNSRQSPVDFDGYLPS